MILKLERDAVPYPPMPVLPMLALFAAYQFWWSFWLPTVAVKCQVLEFKKRVV